jgi:tetratricopeptide (TPR) repeat protein
MANSSGTVRPAIWLRPELIPGVAKGLPGCVETVRIGPLGMGGEVAGILRTSACFSILLLAFMAAGCGGGGGRLVIQGSERLYINEAKEREALRLTHQGNFHPAVRSWMELLEEEPRYARGHYNLAQVYDTLDMVPEAIEHYEIAVTLAEGISPDVGTYSHNLGWAYLRQGWPEAAMKALELALRHHPYDARLHHNLAAAYMANKDYDNALLRADEAVYLAAVPHPDDPTRLADAVNRVELGRYMLRQAEIHLLRGEKDKARAVVERAEKQCRAEVPESMRDKLKD